jgi:Flp pilus assembly protein TadD
MFIFITPRIIRNPGDMAGVTSLKTDVIEKDLPQARQLLINPTDDTHVMALIDEGFEQMQKDNSVAAKELFNKALELDNHNFYARFNLGVISEQEGNPHDAIRMYQIILDEASARAAINYSGPHMMDSALLQSTKDNLERLQMTVSPPVENSKL